MGLNAHVFIKTRKSLSSDEILKLSREMCEALGCEHFYLDKEGKYNTEPTHAIRELSGTFGDCSEQTLEVQVATRFYNQGYERGDFPFIFVLFKWLKFRLPRVRILYSDGCEEAEVTTKYLDELFKHWATVGHQPYYEYFSRNYPTYECPFCDWPTVNHGGGGMRGAKKNFYKCHGCGQKTIIYHNGTRRELQEGEDFITPVDVKHV